ncbi:MAG: GNAT family N-acetyltransferase [Deltaproteobacteria bacterium]|nr:GNAT family N-acetyltransferase [Deltaproteobacteria bacterium]
MIEVIPYEKKYIEDVPKLILPIQQNEFNISITLEDQPDLLEIPDFYQKGLGNFWVALYRSEVVGTISLIDIGNGLCALRKMFVKKEFRGSEYSVAKKLLEKMFDWCKKKGVKEIYLGTTSKYHAAHIFYDKNGFLDIDKNNLPESFPVMEVDSKFYKYSI